MPIYTFHLEKLDGTELDSYSYVEASNAHDAIKKIRCKFHTELINGLRECCKSASELDMFQKTRLIKSK